MSEEMNAIGAIDVAGDAAGDVAGDAAGDATSDVAGDEFDYTLEDLLEEARNDPSWEPDEQKRAELTAALQFQLGM